MISSVWFIAGSSRTGSTLLDGLLGQFDGFVSVGELVDIWDNGVKNNFLCSCGKEFQKCSFWNSVFEEMFGGISYSRLNSIYELHHNVVHYKYLPCQSLSWLQTSSYKNNLKDYQKILSQLYASILKVSGEKVVVDSSKRPHFGMVIDNEEVNVKILHLIRDSRAVAYSWSRKKIRPEIYWTKEYMPRHGAFRSTTEWNIANFFAPRISASEYLRIKYEDLVKNPKQVLSDIFSTLNPDYFEFFSQTLDEVLNLERSSKSSHSVGGNPVRFKKNVNLYVDSEWRQKIKNRDFIIATAMSLPWLVKYNYKLSR